MGPLSYQLILLALPPTARAENQLLLALAFYSYDRAGKSNYLVGLQEV